MRHVRPSRSWWGIVALAGLWACETARNPTGRQSDLIPPTITLTTSADTQQIGSGLQFTVTASDNLSLKDIQLTYSGGYIAQTDTVFTQATTTFNQAVNITFPANSGAGGFIKIVGRATDGASNFATDSITIFLSNELARLHLHRDVLARGRDRGGNGLEQRDGERLHVPPAVASS